MRRRLFTLLLLAALSAGLLPAGAAAIDQGGQVRAPEVAGQFYPQSQTVLQAAVKALMADALAAGPDRPLAILAPHAGYIYSGQIAADAFKQAAAHRYDVVVVLGANHTAAGRHLAISAATAFRTPLGAVPVDRELAQALAGACGDCRLDDSLHAGEHSIEVELPFVQTLWPGAKILPVVVASTDPGVCQSAGRALARVLGDRSALIVASSDLSHYPSHADAARVDVLTLKAAAGFDPPAFHAAAFAPAPVAESGTRACGAGAIMVAQAAAQALGAKRAVGISHATSGDTALGEMGRVVGYGAVAWTNGPPGSDVSALTRPAAVDEGALRAQDKARLLAFARATIDRFLTTGTAPLARGFDARLLRTRGVFVTLKKHGALRGCIGHLAADRPLATLVGAMALQSAFNDPRFEVLSPSELPQIDIEISVMTVPKAIARPEDIVVGRDGVVLVDGSHQAVFLPQVATEQGWDRVTLLDRLAEKAGLAATRWRQGVRLLTFQADVFGEHE